MPAAFQAPQSQLRIKLCIDTACLDMALYSLVDTWCGRKVMRWQRCARTDNAAASSSTWKLG